jgi:hypothetical protein
MFTVLAAIAGGVVNGVFGVVGKWIATARQRQQGRKDQAADDNAATVKQSTQAAVNASAVGQESDTALDTELAKDARS